MEVSKILRKVIHVYSSQLKKRPLLIQILTGCGISAVGDFLVQTYFDDQKGKYSLKRGTVVCSYAGTEIAVEAAIWYPLLDFYLGSQMSVWNAVRKTIADQLLYAPFETAMFMTWINKLERRPERITDKLNRDYTCALVMNFFYWIPTSFALYYWVPLQYRAIYTSLFTFIWDTFMSYATHNNLKEKIAKFF